MARQSPWPQARNALRPLWSLLEAFICTRFSSSSASSASSWSYSA
nr:MAG TPA: hypothetical protein [Caudoviricetes sp.]